jgi:tRNA-specific 2-thiouridylase
MKFGILYSLAARNFGVDAFATGHYARTEFSPARRRVLLRQARDESKDQSYFLYRLAQSQLRAAFFPLGGFDKETVREIAAGAGIPAYDAPESQDFYEGDYGDLIGKKEDPGRIVDLHGTVLGRHTGIWKYTVGQRRGLGISSPVPLYVTGIDPERNRIVVAAKKESERKTFQAVQFNWVSLEGLKNPRTVKVKVRSSSRGIPCSVEQIDTDTVRVTLEEPEAGIAAGQSAVLYDGDLVLGGGTIEYEK